MRAHKQGAGEPQGCTQTALESTWGRRKTIGLGGSWDPYGALGMRSRPLGTSWGALGPPGGGSGLFFFLRGGGF